MATGTISGDRADLVAAWTDEPVRRRRRPRRRDPGRGRARPALRAAVPQGRRAGDEAQPRGRQGPQGAREGNPAAGRAPPRGLGNASIAGRELDTVTAIACKAYVDAVAVRIRNYGHAEAPLSSIGARVMTEPLQGRNPLDLITPRPRRRTARPQPGPGNRRAKRCRHCDPDDPGPDYPGDSDDPEDVDDLAPPTQARRRPRLDLRGSRERPPHRPRRPLRTARAASPPRSARRPPTSTSSSPSAPSSAGPPPPPKPEASASWTDETKALVAAASLHPRTRWSVTLTDPAGLERPEFGGHSILTRPSGLGWPVSHGTRPVTEPQA